MTPKLKRVTVVSVLLLLVAIAVVVIPLVNYSNSVSAALGGGDSVLDILSWTYFGSSGLSSSGLNSSGKTMNIENIGGWNVWVFVFFFLLSQSVIVHHLRQISKSLRSQQKE